jgi:hypothetical protein
VSGAEPRRAHARWLATVRRARRRLPRAAALALATSIFGAVFVAGGGCGGALVRLAKEEQWSELDRRARAQRQLPRGKAARAWAQALVELGNVEEARAVLLHDFRHGGQEQSLLALAELERNLGLLGMAGAHYTRLVDIDLDTLQKSESRAEICELLRARAGVEAEIGEAFAADTDMRRLALVCPADLTAADREFLSSVQPRAQAEAEGRRSLDEDLSLAPEAVDQVELRLAEQLELARQRGPRAVAALAESEGMQVEPDDIAVLLAAEFGGGLGPGLVSSRRLSGWVGDNEVAALVDAIAALPAGVREYAMLRLSSVRAEAEVADERQGWIVAAMASLGGQGPHEAAKAWRVAAAVGDLSGAEFALNTNLRDLIPVIPEGAEGNDRGEDGEAAGEGAPAAKPAHWTLRVPADRRSFDLLLTMARLLEHRGKPVLALELRRSVLVAGYEVGLAQVSAAAVEEVRRQLILGRPWQALAVAEVVPGPLLDEILPAVASAIGLIRAAGLDEADEADRNVVWRSLGDAWFESWDPRLAAALGGLDLGDDGRCPGLGRWLDADAEERLRRVGLDPERSREALEAAFADLAAPATGERLAEALESDLGLSCSAPLVQLLHAGPHALTLETLDERLNHAPELGASTQLQLEAEIALAHGKGDRAVLLTTSAAAQSADPRAVWARAAVAGSSFDAREYTLGALREVLGLTEGLDDAAARRELLLIRLRDVDGDEILREGQAKAVDALRGQLRSYLEEVPAQRRWARLDAVLWTLAGETRADLLAWERLLEIVMDDERREHHPAAVAALERAAAAAGAPLEGEGAPGSDPLAFLSDTQALCEQVFSGGAGAFVEEEGARPMLVGAATVCEPRRRAAALAALVASTPEPARAELRARILAGPFAIEVDPERPGVVQTVSAASREGLILRVVFGLPLEPVWVVDGPPR